MEIRLNKVHEVLKQNWPCIGRFPEGSTSWRKCMDFSNWKPSTIYFDRLETVCIFHLFTCEGDMECTGCGNTEHKGLKDCPDCHLAQISLRKGRRWTSFALWWKLKDLPYPGFKQKCSAASHSQLQLPMFFTFCIVNHQCQAKSEPCVEHSVVWRSVKCIDRQLNLCNIYI